MRSLPWKKWVEYGIAPDSIQASKIQDGEITRSRPLCVYPEVGTFSGVGSTDDADNFYCAALPTRNNFLLKFKIPLPNFSKNL
ncbi:MAG: hypothetical protein Ct9H300mP22_4370 [Gammaproteobacteria bacterium]|nr:MAG: hypothetical protein Ct9H300mP22_4370 [Gammaproteobacteria bacterium]